MKERVILNSKELEFTLQRLCYELIENHGDFSNTAILGLQPRGIFVAQRIHTYLTKITGNKKIEIGKIDITFHRDDFRRRESVLIPTPTEIDFILEGKKVILIDDVLYTGRTIRAGLDAMLAFGRPSLVELLVLIDRRFTRHLPIQANYVGKEVDTIESERVLVQWKETDKKDQILLYSQK
ncbi:MAG: bifunctional pyr operon transcriptional regulator/uracil phosphoribosyltransferase PyrR [Flavobacteriales bacterium]|nr:bifunctional pyr operon transcriptional regulator/uracil phosphoribosyltransferase PyrR [Flavobacteriales bacterium]